MVVRGGASEKVARLIEDPCGTAEGKGEAWRTMAAEANRMSRWRVMGLVVGVLVPACSGGDDSGLTGNPGPAVDGGAGAGGTSGTGGSAGQGGSGGSGGSGGEAGNAGSGGIGGTGGSGGTGGMGGTGGTAGSAGGTGGSGGATGGTGGAAGCPGGCDDAIDCTVDACVEDECRHAPGPCPPSQICDVTQGCVQAPICADVTTCEQLWGNDACKANIRCDDATATCAFDLLDKDNDDHAPIVCGGDDCDDSDAARNPDLVEVCDGKDNNCEGAVDEAVSCPGLLECIGGSCVCPADNACGSECVDKDTNVAHCGACNNACPPTASCVGGSCECPSSQVICDNTCVDTSSDPNHCGGCNQACAPGYSCNGSCVCLETSCSGQCVDTQTDPANCGGCGQDCPPGAACTNGACVCPASAPTQCGGVCVDTQTNDQHCGQCNNACTLGHCQNGSCPTCTPGGMLIMLDQSGSMATNCGTQSCFGAQLGAVQTFVNEADSNGVSVGITFYPRPPGGTSLCTVSAYTQPDVAVDLLPGNRQALLNSMTGRSATGASVIVSALAGSIEAAKAWSLAQSRPVVVVMINDGGLGIGCYTETVAEAVTVSTAGYQGTPSVRTFIIGVNPTGDSQDAQMWSQVPPAGGGTLFDTGNTGYTAILHALQTIRAEVQCP